VDSDVNGRFVFAKLPPGHRQIVRLMSHKSGTATSFADSTVTEVEIHPGEMTTMSMPDVGYKITARLRYPGDVELSPNTHLMFSISTPSPTPPAEAIGHLDLLAQWRETPEFKAAMKTVRSYALGQNDDGSWMTDGVLPGHYIVNASLNIVATHQAYFAHQEVEVPSEPASGAIDLGEIELRPIQTTP
jgi:hypothetical protein